MPVKNKIKEEDVDSVDEDVTRWTREKLMREFENNEFEDLTKDSFFDNDGDDIPTIDDIENHEGLVDNRDFVMGSSNLYEKEDHKDKEPFLPPQAPESMLKIGIELPNISECRSFMRNFAITQRFIFRQKKNEKLCVQIQKSNPDSIATCNREDGNLKFTDMRISFKAVLDGFTKGCRAIHGLDGCFLKGKYGGQFLRIISLDANYGLFPIAVFLCRNEYQATWIKLLT
ncbi:hypothetical protein GIB67_017940 [Kingdonia uniflora]|uniref:Transposase n=1 Tax=Kingdonia uniflora TaxID=39325 RepID=A0A7J7NF09_9MAGN|nr:hypothetical protein GIB67_017940 [Kingdonia uniflora]